MMTYSRFLSLFLLAITLSLATHAQKSGPERWEETIKEFEQRDKENPFRDSLILFVGSSSITIWRDIDKDFPEYKILNRGFGGSQFSDLIFYADRVIYPYKPSKVFIYEGDNDIASGKSTRKVMKDAKKLRRMIGKELPGVPVVFISAKPSVARKHLSDQYEKFNEELRKYANKKKLTMFADVYSAMLDENRQVYEHIFLEDKLHMNAEGYKIWQTVLEPYLREDSKD